MTKAQQREWNDLLAEQRAIVKVKMKLDTMYQENSGEIHRIVNNICSRCLMSKRKKTIKCDHKGG